MSIDLQSIRTASDDAASPTPALDVHGVSIGYRSGRTVRRIVHDVSLRIEPGEVVALVGESGSGKSTLAHSLLGLLPRNGNVTDGTISVGGVDITNWSDRRLEHVRGRQIGFVPQDPSVSLTPWKKVGAHIAEVLRIHRELRGAELRASVLDVLARVGFDDPDTVAERYPHEISGGMCQRVLIGIAIALSPPLIIADEPTSALDVTVQKVVLDRLTTLARESNSGVLLITHDLGVAQERADRVMVLYRGRVVEEGASAVVLARPEHPYTQRLVAAVPTISVRNNPTAALSEPSGEASGGTLLTVDSLVKDFAPRRSSSIVHRAVDEVSLQIDRGRTLALVGESGSGKSTTARIIARLTEPSAGRITFDGHDITALSGKPLRQMRTHIQFVYQNPYASLEAHMSVEHIIAEPLRAFGRGSRRERASKVGELLEQVALPAVVRRRRPAELSGGQRQRVAIARGLALNPSLLILDEPVSALDVSVQARVIDLLIDLQQNLGLSYLFISHDLAVVQQISDTISVMRGGRIVESGPTDQVLTNPTHEYTQTLLDAVPGRSLPKGI